MKRSLVLLAAALALPIAEAQAAKPPPRVLVYSGTVGFKHASIPVSLRALDRMADRSKKFTVRFIDKPAQLTASRLARADIVLWDNTTGAESPFTPEQEAAYVKWVSCGGGHMGVHASADSYKDWPAWLELTGAFFRIHPITPTSISEGGPPEKQGAGQPEARIVVENRTSRITRPWHDKRQFQMREEYYAFDRDPAETLSDFRPLLAFGGFTEPAVAERWDREYADEQPLAWTASYRGRNRIAYTNLGHSGRTWLRADFQTSLREAIRWVGGKRPRAGCLD